MALGEYVGLPESVQAGLIGHACFHAPAHDTTGEHIEEYRQVQPSLLRPNVGDIGGPDLIRCRGCKLPFDQIGHYRPFMIRMGGDFKLALDLGRNAM